MAGKSPATPPDLAAAKAAFANLNGGLAQARKATIAFGAAMKKAKAAFEAAMTIPRTAARGRSPGGDKDESEGKNQQSLRAVLGTLEAVKSKFIEMAAAASPAAYDTLTKSITLLKATVGQQFVPVIIEAARWIQKAAFAFNSLSPEMKNFIAGGVLVAGALGAGALVVGQFAIAALGLKAAIVGAPAAFLAAKAAIVGAVTVVGGAVKSLAVAALANPIAATLAAVTVGLGAFYHALKQVEQQLQESVDAIHRHNRGEFTEQEVKESGLGDLINEKDRGKQIDDAIRVEQEADAEIERRSKANEERSYLGSLSDTVGFTDETQQNVKAIEKANLRKQIAQRVIDKKEIKTVDPAGAGGKAGKGAAGSPDDMLLALSSGKQGSFSGIEDIRKQMQTSLMKDPLTAKIEQIQANELQKLLAAATRIADNTNPDNQKPSPVTS